ncbi:MAG TPA: VOC family protein [Steroidobacteraceae bacterium]|nr:VOC family protein [Steroidobacteraceae bacterium]
MSRVNEIRYIGYAVPDLDAERAFYRDVWGLTEVAEQDGMIYFAAPGHDERFVVRLRQDPVKRVEVVALSAATRADVDALHVAVGKSGARIIRAPEELRQPGAGYGFRFFSPDGLPFEISSDVARGPSRPLHRYEGVPERISHIVMHSPNHRALAQFFIDVLGFRVSDWIGEMMVFLRCNEWHHRLAILPGPPCLNHVAYDMLGVDDVMRGAGRLKSAGVDVRWGPGRHTAGDNVFCYFVTPSGFAVEYTAGLERVDEATWKSQVYPASAQIMDQWGVGVGGPQTMPHPHPDAGLFKAPLA